MDRPTVGSVQILRGNALALALADESVDLIVTSPPYFGLRSYQDGGEHYAGQIGDEPTPAEFVDALIAATAEMVRVLKPSGSIWVNLGDKYSQRVAMRPSSHQDGLQPGREGVAKDWKASKARGEARMPYMNVTDPATGQYVREKSLIGIPWRYAIRCIDDLGLILRAEVIWCLSGGARVYARTATGDRPIMLRDLVRAYRPEDVHLWNGERWTQVLGWNKTPDDDGALEIELRTGERIGCTPGHKWPTQRGVIRADEIRVGDVIETTRLPEPEQPRTPALLPDEDIGWLVGLYIAEGSRSGRMVQIAGHLNETERHARLARIAKALDGQCNVYQTSENGSTCNLSGSVILGVLDRYISPGTAKTKRLRAAAWQRSDTFLRAVVEGYLSGDGHFDAKNDRWRLGFTANDEWAADLRTIAARLGSKLSLRRAVHTSRGRQFPGWRGEWRWTRSAHHNAKQDGEVVAIRASRARDFYDVGVADEPHLFALASGVLTHNSKPNGLPESVTDRVRRSHETWFHFTREPRYFSAVDEIREPSGPEKACGPGAMRGPRSIRERGTADPTMNNPLGKLPGSVWTIPTEPLHVPESLGIDHFAAFPTEWPRRIIQGWSPSGICTECGEGRRRERSGAWHFQTPGHEVRQRALRQAQDAGVTADLVGTEYDNHSDGDRNVHPEVKRLAADFQISRLAASAAMAATKRGMSDTEACACPEPTAPTRPAVVLDPFGGTGTTALVAKALGRHGISNDMSADYCRLAGWRTTDPKQLAKAARRPFVPPAEQTEGQLDLLEGIA